MRKIEWTPDGLDSLNEILEYYKNAAGENVANNILKAKAGASASIFTRKSL